MRVVVIEIVIVIGGIVVVVAVGGGCDGGARRHGDHRPLQAPGPFDDLVSDGPIGRRSDRPLFPDLLPQTPDPGQDLLGPSHPLGRRRRQRVDLALEEGDPRPVRGSLGPKIPGVGSRRRLESLVDPPLDLIADGGGGTDLRLEVPLEVVLEAFEVLGGRVAHRHAEVTGNRSVEVSDASFQSRDHGGPIDGGLPLDRQPLDRGRQRTGDRPFEGVAASDGETEIHPLVRVPRRELRGPGAQLVDPGREITPSLHRPLLKVPHLGRDGLPIRQEDQPLRRRGRRPEATVATADRGYERIKGAVDRRHHRRPRNVDGGIGGVRRVPVVPSQTAVDRRQRRRRGGREQRWLRQRRPVRFLARPQRAFRERCDAVVAAFRSSSSFDRHFDLSGSVRRR
mmetsp:Transcript_2719/g.7456  ORF Transcript_2719/g.7456 Transcript_2719/m.7456 type:complete len:395 (+) Transcript_2719:87-1271(+)